MKWRRGKEKKPGYAGFFIMLNLYFLPSFPFLVEEDSLTCCFVLY